MDPMKEKLKEKKVDKEKEKEVERGEGSEIEKGNKGVESDEDYQDTVF
ncbi:MAG: hypothetical protein ACOYL6_01075 [Bacteriovoracaceae bacterium]